MRNMAVSVQQRGSLVERGLLAIQNGTKLAQTKDNDALYRQVSGVSYLIADNGGATCVGVLKAQELTAIVA